LAGHKNPFCLYFSEFWHQLRKGAARDNLILFSSHENLSCKKYLRHSATDVKQIKQHLVDWGIDPQFGLIWLQSYEVMFFFWTPFSLRGATQFLIITAENVAIILIYYSQYFSILWPRVFPTIRHAFCRSLCWSYNFNLQSYQKSSKTVTCCSKSYRQV
jgi:hypothetical protein